MNWTTCPWLRRRWGCATARRRSTRSWPPWRRTSAYTPRQRSSCWPASRDSCENSCYIAPKNIKAFHRLTDRASYWNLGFAKHACSFQPCLTLIIYFLAEIWIADLPRPDSIVTNLTCDPVDQQLELQIKNRSSNLPPYYRPPGYCSCPPFPWAVVAKSHLHRDATFPFGSTLVSRVLWIDFVLPHQVHGRIRMWRRL